MGIHHTSRLALITCIALAWPAKAELWSDFYRSSTPPDAAQPDKAAPAILQDDAVCIAEILEAQAAYAIPDNLLLAIGLQEAGRYGGSGLTVWPWTVNAAGEGAFFATKKDMLDWVRQKQAAGIRSIDVGCMQVNQKWHAKAFTSLEQASEPHSNVQYAARHLAALFREEGNWWKAAGRYHSSTTQYQQTYLVGLSRNMRVARAEMARFADMLVTQTAELAPVRTPAPSVFWGGGETGGEEPQSAGFSIYSNNPIRPVLPGYDERF